MENDPLRQQIASVKQSLLNEGTLDSNFFHLEQLQGPNNPNSLELLASLFLRDSVNNIIKIERKINSSPVDFSSIERLIQELRAKSSRIGAPRVSDKLYAVWNNCNEDTVESFKASLQELKLEIETLSLKLATYFALVRQTHPNGVGPSR
ncbi:pseudo histidine-containing phosphotransfer protein 2-like [Hevea brasiliensis]|uniref:pseudo histidine-containing phosphotransfer protein 2-like n=1 Tax=Hevea brasiliensis TaxID=3981 RepID=UPI0025DD71A2|nr:pseudo histidine-containing phosphotransfer protein 2-like [Hevea brasiliensis]